MGRINHTLFLAGILCNRPHNKLDIFGVDRYCISVSGTHSKTTFPRTFFLSTGDKDYLILEVVLGVSSVTVFFENFAYMGSNQNSQGISS